MSKTIMQWIREFLGKRDPAGELPDSTPSAEQITDLIGKVTDERERDNLILTKLKNALNNETDIAKNHESAILALQLLNEGGADTLTSESREKGSQERGADDSRDFGNITNTGDSRGGDGAAGGVKAGSDAAAGEEKPSEKTGCCPYAVKRNIVKSIEEIERFAKEHELAAEVLKAVLTALAEMTLSAMKGKVNGAILLLILNALNFDKAKAAAYKEGELAGRNAKIEEKYFPQNDDGLPHFRGMKERSNEIGIFNLARKA